MRSARRKPLAALLCVLAAVVAGSGVAAALAASPPSVPPAPVLTTYPPDPNGTATSTFVWTDSQAGVTFLCSVENSKFASTVPSAGGSPQPCSSPLTYNVDTSNNGTHQFAVEAIDALGNVSSITKYSWKVPKTALPITISGNAGVVYPGGGASAFQTAIYNPNTGPITITSLTVSLGNVPGVCQASWFLPINQSNVSPGNPLTIAGNSTVTLPQGTVSAPSVAMGDSGKQDSCEGQTIPVNYDGGFGANFSVGTPSPFTFTVTNATGGPMYPGATSLAARESETYKVNNPSPGAQNLNQVVISVANNDGSSWSSQTNSVKPACTKNDFELSLDGSTWAPAGTSVTDTNIATDLAGGASSAQHTVYIRMRDNGLNQDNCQDLTNVPLYYSAG